MTRHLPGEPVHGVQRCSRCGRVLVDWAGYEAQVVAGEPTHAMFWRSGEAIVVDGPFSGTAGDNYPDVPDCTPATKE